MHQIGDKVRCYASAGWGGHQGNLMDAVAYSGDGLGDDGMPVHGRLYCVRGVDSTCNKPAVYLVGITGARRPDGTEMSFGASGFLSPRDFARRAAET